MSRRINVSLATLCLLSPCAILVTLPAYTELEKIVSTTSDCASYVCLNTLDSHTYPLLLAQSTACRLICPHSAGIVVVFDTKALRADPLDVTLSVSPSLARPATVRLG